MERFTTLRSKVVPLPIKDVDTDMIIPAQFLTSISREGYGQNVFRRLRDTDPNFPLSQERYKQASILVADSNFGCGSSREHAVWALLGAGIKAIIAKSFADIFYSNSAKNGLLLIELPAATIDSMIEESTQREFVVTINLEDQIVSTDKGKLYSFDYDPFRKHCLLNGLDDIDYILAFQKSGAKVPEQEQSDRL